MSPSLLALISQIIQIAVTAAPGIIKDVNLIMELLSSGKDPSPEQQAQIDEALDRANAAVAAIAVSDDTVPVSDVEIPEDKIED